MSARMTIQSRLCGESRADVSRSANRPTASIRLCRAKGEGADYIGFGPLFATPTKPAYQPIGVKDIKRVHEEVALPIFCIGGIKLDNLEQVIVAGARRVVIVSGLLQAPDIAQYAGAAKQVLASQSNRNPQSAA